MLPPRVVMLTVTAVPKRAADILRPPQTPNGREARLREWKEGDRKPEIGHFPPSWLGAP